MDKSQLRHEARRRRRGLGQVHRQQAQLAFAQTLVARRQREGWTAVAAYVGTASEASLAPWFASLAATSPALRLFLPAIDGQGAMSFRAWRPGEPLDDGPFGIAQPAAAAMAADVGMFDAILLPLLGFDRHGTRLGSGAGYYDRALAPIAAAAPRPRIVGIAFAVQRFDALPRDAWDIPLDAIVTEDGWLDLPA